MKKLIRYKKFLKDWNKTKLTEGQFAKFIHYAACLQQDEPLPPESKDHALTGEYKDCREFHLGGDMLVIYSGSEEAVFFIRIGTHSQLFN